MNDTFDRTKKFFARTLGAAAIAGTAAMGFGAAIASADPQLPPLPPLPSVPPDGCKTCAIPRPNLNPQPLPPGFGDHIPFPLDPDTLP